MANKKMMMSVFVFDTQNWYNDNYGGEERFISEFDLLCKSIIKYKNGLMFRGNQETGIPNIIFTIPNQSIKQKNGYLEKSNYNECDSLMVKITSDETLNNNCKPLFYSKMYSDNQGDRESLLKDNQNVYDDNLIAEELIKLNQLIIHNNWNNKYNVNIFLMSQDKDFCPRLQSFANNNIRVHLICHDGNYGKYIHTNLYKKMQKQDEYIKNQNIDNNLLLCLESTESFYEKIQFNSKYMGNGQQPSSSLNTESDSSDSEQNNNTQQHQRLTEDQILEQLTYYDNYDGNTNLHVASEKGNLDVVRYCIQSCGADIGAKNKYGQTPLYKASLNGHLEVVNYLKSVGATM